MNNKILKNDYIDFSLLLEEVNPIFDKIIAGVSKMDLEHTLTKKTKLDINEIIIPKEEQIILDNYFKNIENLDSFAR